MRNVLPEALRWGALVLLGGLASGCATPRLAVHPEVLRAGAEELLVERDTGTFGRGVLCFGDWCARDHVAGAEASNPVEDPFSTEEHAEVQKRMRFTFLAADDTAHPVSCVKRTTVTRDVSSLGPSATTRVMSCEVSLPGGDGQQGHLEVTDGSNGQVARGQLTLGKTTLELESTRQLEGRTAPTVMGFHLRAGEQWTATVATGDDGRVWMVKALAPEVRDAAALAATVLLLQGAWDDAGALEPLQPRREERYRLPPPSQDTPGKRATDVLSPRSTRR